MFDSICTINKISGKVLHLVILARFETIIAKKIQIIPIFSQTVSNNNNNNLYLSRNYLTEIKNVFFKSILAKFPTDGEQKQTGGTFIH